MSTNVNSEAHLFYTKLRVLEQVRKAKIAIAFLVFALVVVLWDASVVLTLVYTGIFSVSLPNMILVFLGLLVTSNVAYIALVKVYQRINARASLERELAIILR